jgi:hypothetical protein
MRRKQREQGLVLVPVPGERLLHQGGHPEA